MYPDMKSLEADTIERIRLYSDDNDHCNGEAGAMFVKYMGTVEGERDVDFSTALSAIISLGKISLLGSQCIPASYVIE